MTIGEKIRELRQQNNVTQEKLAEYLNISFQSVSKWENNLALPDISFVIPLANFFGVSTDELFDRTCETERAELHNLYERDVEFVKNLMPEPTKENLLGRVAMWRAAAQKYPKNFDVLFSLLMSLLNTVTTQMFDNETVQANAKETAAVAERILRDCTDEPTRQETIRFLVMLYGLPFLDIASESTAEKYANMAGSFHNCRELLLEYAYFTEEGKRKQRERRSTNNRWFMNFICDNIHTDARTLPPEEAVSRHETALKLWETLIPDGDFQNFSGSVAQCAFFLAETYAILGKRDETLATLHKAVAYSETDKMGRKRYFLEKACFDFVRDDADFPPIG